MVLSETRRPDGNAIGAVSISILSYRVLRLKYGLPLGAKDILHHLCKAKGQKSYHESNNSVLDKLPSLRLILILLPAK